MFSLDSLQVNITKHILVPKLEILSKDESEVIKNKMKLVNYNQFPQFVRADPHAKFCGVRSGELCKITRTSETSGVYINYRYLG